MTRIAAGLEQAFAKHGFARPSVDDLRDATGVSLRTLYKYAPSRDDMVLAALAHRHRRYMQLIFSDLPDSGDRALSAIIDRIANWMSREGSHGCLFHAAVAAAPENASLLALLKRHKSEVASEAARASNLEGHETDLTLIIEGLTQSWPLKKAAAVASAKRFCKSIRK